MRTTRLLDLLQALRRRRRPVSAQTLADELGVSLRTLYRDVTTLRAQGAEIHGEPGIGYVLRPSFFLPPMMLSQAETEALMLGMRWVSTFGDKSLAVSAASALAKIEEVLPKAVRDGAGAVPLRVGAAQSQQLAAEDLAPLREAIREERKLAFSYSDQSGRRTQRVIWPFAIGLRVRLQHIGVKRGRVLHFANPRCSRNERDRSGEYFGGMAQLESTTHAPLDGPTCGVLECGCELRRRCIADARTS